MEANVDATAGRPSVASRVWGLKRAGRLFLSYLTVFLIWWFLSRLMGPVALPSPDSTFAATLDILFNSKLGFHVLLTFWRTVLGVAVSAVIGLVVVLIARYVRPFRAFFLDAFYPGLRAVPALSIALLAVVWFKLGTASVVFVVMVTVLPIYLIDLWEGIKVVDGTLVEMATVITRKKLRIFRKIIFPMIIPSLFAATKLGFSVSFKLALVGEVLAATDGMGYMLLLSIQELKTDYVFGWTFIVVLFVVFFDYYFFDFVERKFLYRWETLV